MPTSSAKSLREPEIKAALIDVLFADGRIDDDTVVVSEMPVASMARRADIVVANGHLLGFEIKSDGDKTVRLRGQIEAYQKSFEGTVIVTGARHLSEVLECAPDIIGVVAIDRIHGDVPMARMVRKPHLRKMSMDTAIRQMRVNDLYGLTRSLGLNPTGARDRYTLEKLARNVPHADLRIAALGAIKHRYRRQFDDFRMAREQRGSTMEALRFLRRPAWNNGHQSATPIAVEQAVSPPTEAGDITSLTLNVLPRRTD